MPLLRRFRTQVPAASNNVDAQSSRKARPLELMKQSSIILLVENDKDFIYLLEQAFRTAGVCNPLKIARYGNEAILYLRGIGIYSDRQSYPLPRSIILDLTNPDGSSLALLGWIRDQQEFAKVPVLVLAGPKQQIEVQHAFDRGANAFIEKQGDLAQLTRAVASIELFTEVRREFIAISHFSANI